MRFVDVGHGRFAKVDDADFALVSAHEWHVSKGEARSYLGKRGQYLRMHRLIMDAPADRVVDHRNGDKLDNQRSTNLRVCEQINNIKNRKRSKANRSGFKGVYAERGYYRAQIKSDGRKHCLGSFPTPERAHEAYCQAAKRLHGEFARFA